MSPSTLSSGLQWLPSRFFLVKINDPLMASTMGCTPDDCAQCRECHHWLSVMKTWLLKAYANPSESIHWWKIGNSVATHQVASFFKLKHYQYLVFMGKGVYQRSIFRYYRADCRGKGLATWASGPLKAGYGWTWGRQIQRQLIRERMQVRLTSSIGLNQKYPKTACWSYFPWLESLAGLRGLICKNVSYKSPARISKNMLVIKADYNF